MREGLPLEPAQAGVPMSPITIDLLRRRPTATPAVSPVSRIGPDTWQFAIAAAVQADPAGLATAPVTDTHDR